MEKVDLIPDEVVRASFALGDSDGVDGLDVTLRLSLGGVALEPRSFDLPALDILAGIPGLRLLIDRVPDLVPTELVQFDIALGDANQNGSPDVVTEVRFAGSDEPRFERLREVTKEEAFDVVVRLLSHLKGK